MPYYVKSKADYGRGLVEASFLCFLFSAEAFTHILHLSGSGFYIGCRII